MGRVTEPFADGVDFGELARREIAGPRSSDERSSGPRWLPSGDLLVVAMTSRQVHRVAPDGGVRVHADVDVQGVGWP